MTTTLGTIVTRRSLVKSIAGIGITAAVLSPSLGLFSPVAARSTDSRIVNTESARLRSGPGTGYSIVATLAKGTEVQYLAYGGSATGYEWHKVMVVTTGTQGFIAANLLSMPGNGTGSDPIISGQRMTTSAVNLRSGPSTSNSVLRVVASKSLVQSSDTIQNGFRYVVHLGLAGWIADSYLAPPTDMGPVPSSQTTTSTLNLRAEPSTSAKILLVIPSGAKVSPNGDISNGFAKVTYNGTSGWAFRDYLI